ncbi:MAG: type II toxin-antitoxin system RelE/ParE family toxin [Candidatus Omnitrophica bacterium]|nr:type II toxin-antitoxin system RelE/ParE family toxin [Candidatus Omnitrophota bacterium]
MIRSFKNRGTEDVFEGTNSKAAKKICPSDLWIQAGKKLDLLDSAVDLEDLKIPPGNRLEALKGERKGQHSIRINDQFRICFQWGDQGSEQVEIVDYH